MAQTHLPDLIISDVMMPIMDGMAMTTAIKASPLTKTIPVILLTAKSTKRETVEGLQSGADDYLTKPFDTSELIVRVAGLINSRKVLRDSLENKWELHAIPLAQKSVFSEKLRSEILAQLSNSDFSVEHLASTMALSRRSLERKCQQELQQSIGQYINDVRMQIAIKLLKEKSHSISEVAYGIGFESLAYFSRTFKKHYGKCPSEIA